MRLARACERLGTRCVLPLGARAGAYAVAGSPTRISSPIPQLSSPPLKYLKLTQQISTRHYSGGTDVRGLGDSTIYALSTAPGRAAIAVIRISGSQCTTIYQSLCPSRALPKPRYAAVRTLYRPGQSSTAENVLDSNALVLYFPGPRTVTGEDVLELHVHGGPAIVKAVLSAISQCASQAGSIRYAEPGEFTRRAFLNGRLDLTQVEALGDTLSATTEQQRRLSVRGTSNQLATQYETWRSQLLYARGELEALIDFSEDQHFDESPVELISSIAMQVLKLRRALEAHTKNAVRGELLRNGIILSLLGAPNVGKSSLLNRIVGREAAIVSQEAGTTRDVVEVGIDLGGFLCRLGDTAGLRKKSPSNETSGNDSKTLLSDVIGKIEEEGMRRAKQRAAESDVVIAVFSFEPDSNHGPVREYVLDLDPEVVSTANGLAKDRANVIVVVNKIDQKNKWSVQEVIDTAQSRLPDVRRDHIHCISCKLAASTNHNDVEVGGIQSFLKGVTDLFHDLTKPVEAETSGQGAEADESIWHESLGATERHRLLLEKCQEHLDEFLQEARQSEAAGHEASDEEADVDLVLAAEHLRAAADCLAKITGKGEAGDVEEVLGVVFEKFCVGK